MENLKVNQKVEILNKIFIVEKECSLGYHLKTQNNNPSLLLKENLINQSVEKFKNENWIKPYSKYQQIKKNNLLIKKQGQLSWMCNNQNNDYITIYIVRLKKIIKQIINSFKIYPKLILQFNKERI